MTRKVLIVDDTVSNKMILKKMLEREYDTVEAATGEEALKVLAQDQDTISAVLLDINMRGINGFEVLNRIHTNQKLSSISVIMIIGNEDEESRVKSLLLGANDYVTKPYNAAIIMQCLQNCIGLRETAATV